MIFVCLCGTAIGLLFIAAAVREWEWVYGFWDVEACRVLFGETYARWFCAGIGIAIILLTGFYCVRNL